MNDLETHVLELIGEDTDSPDVFTDTDTGMAPIRDSLNDAIEEITMLTGSVKRPYYVPLIADRAFYRLSFQRDSFAWITDAWIYQTKKRLTQTDLIKLNSFNPRWMLNSGTPEAYCPVGLDKVCFWPTPAATGGMVEFTCVVIPQRYTSSADRIAVREEFKWAAVHYAVSEYYASRGDAKQALEHLNLYVEKSGIQTLYPQAQERTWGYKTNKEYWPRVNA